MASNGGKAWDRLVEKVDKIEATTHETRIEIGRIKLRLDMLPCNERGPRLTAVEKALDGRVSTRALVTSVITAVIMAVLVSLAIGAKFLS